MAADEKGFFEDWPTWSKPVLALSAMILLGGIWIGVPLLSAWALVKDSAQTAASLDYGPMMAVLTAMTTATIAGIFVFMTFRIDRGTRLKAERVAKKTTKEVVKKKFGELYEDAKCEVDKKLDELTKSEAIEQAVQHRIPEETFRSYVQAVLLANANGQIVAEYAKERATYALTCFFPKNQSIATFAAFCAVAARSERPKCLAIHPAFRLVTSLVQRLGRLDSTRT